MYIDSWTQLLLCAFKIPFLIITINWLFMVTVNQVSVSQLARHQLHNCWTVSSHTHTHAQNHVITATETHISSACQLTCVSQGYTSTGCPESHLNLSRFPQSFLVILWNWFGTYSWDPSGGVWWGFSRCESWYQIRYHGSAGPLIVLMSGWNVMELSSALDLNGTEHSIWLVPKVPFSAANQEAHPLRLRSHGSRPIGFACPMKGSLEYHHGDEFGRQPSSAAHFLPEHFLWVTHASGLGLNVACVCVCVLHTEYHELHVFF